LKKLSLKHCHDATLISRAQKKMPQHLLGPVQEMQRGVFAF